jgi:arylsulfatase A
MNGQGKCKMKSVKCRVQSGGKAEGQGSRVKDPRFLTVSQRPPVFRRQFALSIFHFSLLVLLSTPLPLRAAEPRPNVILIYTDDQGIGDVGVYGAGDIMTPNIDALCRSGVRFTQFYTASPVCSPSRAALMTGRYPQRAGLATNAGSQPGDATGMPAEQVTIAEMLKAAGYATGHVGKWHMGYQKPMMPNAQGFDYSFGHMGGCIDNYSHFFYWQGPNRHDLWINGKEIWRDGQFFGDLMVRECRNFIEAHQDRPFFLYWAINMPHYPLQATARWRQRYEDVPEPRARYAAFVSTMDQMIGQVMMHLEDLGLRDKTIVIFQSDHGHSMEERTFGGGGSAGPYRGAKFSMFEGGIRVPAAISWPGRITDTEIRQQLATNVDWMPTIAEFCRVELPDRPIDGRSLVSVIESAQSPSPHEIFHWQLGQQWAVRKGPWKLIGNPQDTSQKGRLTDSDKLFLVNIDEDPSEMTNVAGRHPQIVEELRGLHESWARDVNVQ